jgi:hypothetical protein
VRCVPAVSLDKLVVVLNLPCEIRPISATSDPGTFVPEIYLIIHQFNIERHRVQGCYTVLLITSCSVL